MAFHPFSHPAGPTNGRNGARPWKNASYEVDDALGLLSVTVKTPVDRDLARAARAKRLGSDRRHQWSHTEDRDHSLEVVGQDVEAHLGSDLVQGAGQASLW